MMSGPGYGLDNYTLGAMITNEMVLWLAVPAAMMSIFLVVRHTRAEEETGRAELIRSAVVGRYAAPVSALIVASLANVGVAVLTALAMISGGLDATDSVAVGIGLGLTGLAFAGVATVTAQLTEHARSASSVAMAVLGAAFLVRAVGDAARAGGRRNVVVDAVRPRRTAAACLGHRLGRRSLRVRGRDRILERLRDRSGGREPDDGGDVRPQRP